MLFQQTLLIFLIKQIKDGISYFYLFNNIYLHLYYLFDSTVEETYNTWPGNHNKF